MGYERKKEVQDTSRLFDLPTRKMELPSIEMGGLRAKEALVGERLTPGVQHETLSLKYLF